MGKINRRAALTLGGAALLGAAAGVGAATPASAASAWVRLPLVTANIGRKNLAARGPAIRDVRAADDTRPLVGWQEISEGDSGEPALIEQHFGSAYRNTFLRHDTAFRVPISVPAPWVVVDTKPTFVHGGIAGVSPPRWITEVVVRHETIPGLQFAVINTHYIAGAYNGAQNPDLRDEWNLHKQTHRDRVIAQHQQGRLVFWTADTNNPGYDKATGQDAERKAFGSGIDRIDWLPPGNGSVQVELLNTKSVAMDVDGHDARVAIFRVRTA
ncbi:hypothetical protein [Actinokineospora bangkokensis]|uniref:hypothetical protein n=1 Tax=Actinokineospora bangkokensis TaxID=1193682 RepID=UPI0011776A15|nr:hypothetical protein [Actinokineospora bangkokensis]